MGNSLDGQQYFDDKKMKGAPQHHRSGNCLHNQREAQKKVVRNQVLNIENVRQQVITACLFSSLAYK